MIDRFHEENPNQLRENHQDETLAREAVSLTIKGLLAGFRNVENRKGLVDNTVNGSTSVKVPRNHISTTRS
jgi:hypothetical protein